MPADEDPDRTWAALAQHHVDLIQRHVVDHSVIDLDDLVPAPSWGNVDG